MDLTNLWAQSAGIGASAGIFLPLIAAVVLRPHWTAATKQWIVGALSILVGLGTVAATGAFSGGPVLSAATVAAVFAASQVAHTALWHKYGITQAIEVKTSPTPLEEIAGLIMSGKLQLNKALGESVTDEDSPASGV